MDHQPKPCVEKEHSAIRLNKGPKLSLGKKSVCKTTCFFHHNSIWFWEQLGLVSTLADPDTETASFI